MRRSGLLMAMAMAMAMPAAMFVGATASSAAAGTATTSVGQAPRVPAGAVSRPALSGGTVLHVDVTLQPNDPADLAELADAVSTPGSSLYRHYITPNEFAEFFGASPTAVEAVRNALTASGLDPGPVSANHLSIPVTATAGQLSRAFSTSFDQYRLSSGRVAYANTSAPVVVRSVAPFVQGIIGLDDLNVPTSDLAQSPPLRRSDAQGKSKPAIVTGGPQPCPAATSDASANDTYTADQLASAYGFSHLYGAGDLAAGQTVAVFELESNLASDIAAFQSCYGTDTPVSYVKVDGGPPAGPGEGEAALDIEDIISLAPDATVLDYEAPWEGGTGWYDNWNAIVSQDIAKVVSISWGICESEDSGQNPAAENTLFQEAATQGQTILVAAGDAGSEDCLDPWESLNKKNDDDGLAVDDPGSQPYVTDVGGTTLSALGPPPVESVWNDGMGGGAGAGGISAAWPMPSYQSDADPSVGVINAYSSGSPCGASAGHYCREVPDVSADADPDTGYEIYWDGFWTGTGGTSAASPTWAALIALTNGSSACSGETIGFANPDLYGVAGTHSGAFNDITTGENDIAGVHSGLYPALAGYDMASGLGSPNGATLPSDLCAGGGTPEPVTVTNPGFQSTDLGQSVSLQIRAADSSIGQTLKYSAIGLPTGLSISSSSGLITGTPTVSGVSTPVVFVEDGNGASNAVTFYWSVPSSITKMKPTKGPSSGGTKVTIKGSGFQGAAAVMFGGASVYSPDFTVNKQGTKITVYTPAGTGSVDVQVVGPSGISPVTSHAVFTYS
jgi:subtilase family serine protease